MAAGDRIKAIDNRDSITDEPGAHPVGTGIGATGGAIAGKAAAESVNPTDEEAYWRNNYTREAYYQAGRTYNDYGPAYELGWSYRARYGDDFDNYESNLASDWENRRGLSKLSWLQARSASRAAWERVDDQSEGVHEDSPVDIGNEEVVFTLNGLIETCCDGEYGFTACAEHTHAADLKALFRRRASQCSESASELRAHVSSLGGTPATSGSASGAMHRGWVAVRGTLSGYSDYAMLDECERGEDATVARYRQALKTGLPSELRVVVERQQEGVQTSHGQIKKLREQKRARSSPE